MFPPERKWQISQKPDERDENDGGNPKFLLPRAEWLRLNARDRTGQNDQPNQRKAKPDLAAEFRGMQAETVEKFTHRN